MAMVSASATLPPNIYPLSPFFSSFPNSSPSFFKILTNSSAATSTTLTRPFFSPSFVLKDDRYETIATFDQDEVEEEEEEMIEDRETVLYSFTPLPLLLVAALPGAGAVRSLFGPFVELVKSWNLPDWLVHWGHPGNMLMMRGLVMSLHISLYVFFLCIWRNKRKDAEE